MTITAPPAHGSGLGAMLRLPHALPLALSCFLLGFGLSLAVPYMALYAVKKAGMSPLQLGLFLTVNAISAVVVATLLARWSDRLPNRKPILLATMAAGMAAYALIGVTPHFAGLLLIGAALLSLGAAAFPQMFSFARASLQDVPSDLADRAMTLLRAVFSLSWVVGPGLGAVILGGGNYTAVFLSAAACFALAALPLTRVPGRRPQPTPGITPDLPDTPRLAARRAIALGALAFVLYGMSMQMGMAMFPLFITETLRGTSGEVGFLVGLCALLEIPVMVALVTWRRLPGVPTLVAAGMALFVAHFALVYVSDSLPLLIAAQVIRAVVLAILAGLGMTYFQTLMPGRFSAATTLFANTGSIGGMLSGITSGAVAQTLGYRSVFLVCGALTLLAFLVMAWTHRRPAQNT
ncbi:putative sugar efflux transporter [Deinococcus radiotolerans]|uniref:Sugar efflux transporter n=2 Tax=Deinococcus radiotolerans TaxID=1309407 RepID=A0ABQ2FDZ2_9DEIO|nr:sugar efflux transporter [Deinococcus radiotolerans]GGK88421.1 putative sugar efflux transporter [Deinococcus radiotolerans]